MEIWCTSFLCDEEVAHVWKLLQKYKGETLYERSSERESEPG